jgi:hypothetical protein
MTVLPPRGANDQRVAQIALVEAEETGLRALSSQGDGVAPMIARGEARWIGVEGREAAKRSDVIGAGLPAMRNCRRAGSNSRLQRRPSRAATMPVSARAAARSTYYRAGP